MYYLCNENTGDDDQLCGFHINSICKNQVFSLCGLNDKQQLMHEPLLFITDVDARSDQNLHPLSQQKATQCGLNYGFKSFFYSIESEEEIRCVFDDI